MSGTSPRHAIVLFNMCGKCEGEPYRGIKALFNGDLQTKGGFEDRADWTVLSSKVAVYLGESAFKNTENPLFRACSEAIESLTIDERTALVALSKSTKRPVFGSP